MDKSSAQCISATFDNEESSCWICLLGAEAGELSVPCQCSARPVHRACLARWQLQAAGKQEECQCRFCNQALPDWRQVLTPKSIKPVTPVMAIKFEGREYKLRVKPGPEGLAQFKEQVQELLGFNITEEFEVSFECQVPSTGEMLKLNGLKSYGAATHCAAITAGEREVLRPHRTPRTRSTNHCSGEAPCTSHSQTHPTLMPTPPSGHAQPSPRSMQHHTPAPWAHGMTPGSRRPNTSNQSAGHQPQGRASTSQRFESVVPLGQQGAVPVPRHRRPLPLRSCSSGSLSAPQSRTQRVTGAHTFTAACGGPLGGAITSGSHSPSAVSSQGPATPTSATVAAAVHATGAVCHPVVPRLCLPHRTPTHSGEAHSVTRRTREAPTHWSREHGAVGQWDLPCRDRTHVTPRGAPPAHAPVPPSATAVARGSSPVRLPKIFSQAGDFITKLFNPAYKAVQPSRGQNRLPAASGC